MVRFWTGLSSFGLLGPSKKISGPPHFFRFMVCYSLGSFSFYSLFIPSGPFFEKKKKSIVERVKREVVILKRVANLKKSGPACTLHCRHIKDDFQLQHCPTPYFVFPRKTDRTETCGPGPESGPKVD